MARRDGILALQLHAGPPMKVEFRNIRLRELPAAGRSRPRRAPARRRSSSWPARRATDTPSTNIMPAACCWPSALPRACRTSETIVCDEISVPHNGHWPRNPKALENADAIVVFSDGYDENPIMPLLRPDRRNDAAGSRAGLHPLRPRAGQGEAGRRPEGLDRRRLRGELVGQSLLDRRVQATARPSRSRRGVRPFAIRDEWYYQMRFVDNMAGRDADPDGRAAGRNPPAALRPGQRQRGRPRPHGDAGGRGLGAGAARRRPRLRLHRRPHALELGQPRLPHAGPQRHRLGGEDRDSAGRGPLGKPPPSKNWKPTRTSRSRPTSTAKKCGR